jgi:hypothetical protein
MVRRTRRPNGSDPVPVYSVRVPRVAWEKAKRRAAYEGITVSAAAALFVEGYGEGFLDLPKITRTYTQPREESQQLSSVGG